MSFESRFIKKCLKSVAFLAAFFLPMQVFAGPNDLPDDPTQASIEINDSNFGDMLKNMDEKVAYLQNVKEGARLGQALDQIMSDYYNENKQDDPAKTQNAILTVLRIIDYDSRDAGDGYSLISRIPDDYKPGVAEFANGQKSWKGFKNVFKFGEIIQHAGIRLSNFQSSWLSTIDLQISGWHTRYHALVSKALSLPEEQRKPIFDKLGCSNACCMLGFAVK